MERVNREIKRRTRAIGAFPDGQSALMLVCARLRHVASSSWGMKKYLNMAHLDHLEFKFNIHCEEYYNYTKLLLSCYILSNKLHILK